METIRSHKILYGTIRLAYSTLLLLYGAIGLAYGAIEAIELAKIVQGEKRRRRGAARTHSLQDTVGTPLG